MSESVPEAENTTGQGKERQLPPPVASSQTNEDQVGSEKRLREDMIDHASQNVQNAGSPVGDPAAKRSRGEDTSSGSVSSTVQGQPPAPRQLPPSQQQQHQQQPQSQHSQSQPQLQQYSHQNNNGQMAQPLHPPPHPQQQLPHPTNTVNAQALELSRQNASKRDQNWDSQFEALLAYAEKYNHCNVRPGYTVDIDDKVGVNLYAWLALQRRHKKHNKLRPDRLRKMQLLVDAGKLSWTADSGGKAEDDDEYVHVLPPPPPPSWGSHYDALLIYVETHGTANVDVGHVISIDGGTKIDLGSWLEDQRKAKIRNTLESLHLRRLDNLAREDKLSWHTPDSSVSRPRVSETELDAQWQEKYEATKAYVALHPQGCLGDEIDVRLRIEVPAGQQPSNPFDLFQWVRAQRMGHFHNTLKPYRKRLLQELVDRNLFSWMSQEEATLRERKAAEKRGEESILWTAWYNALVWLGNNRGECNLNSHGTITLPDGSEAELGKWLHIQKKYIKNGTLAVDRCVKLLQLMQENKLDRNYWVKYFLLSYPANTFVADFPELFPGQVPVVAPSQTSENGGDMQGVGSGQMQQQQQQQLQHVNSEAQQPVVHEQQQPYSSSSDV